jgi:hypothetical protein
MTKRKRKHEQPTPGTPEWAQFVAEQKTHPERDGHDPAGRDVDLPELEDVDEEEDG